MEKASLWLIRTIWDFLGTSLGRLPDYLRNLAKDDSEPNLMGCKPSTMSSLLFSDCGDTSAHSFCEISLTCLAMDAPNVGLIQCVVTAVWLLRQKEVYEEVKDKYVSRESPNTAFEF